MLEEAKYLEYLKGKKIEKVFLDTKTDETVLHFTDGTVLRLERFIYRDYV